MKVRRTTNVKLLSANLNKMAYSEVDENFPLGSRNIFHKNISLLFVG